MTEELETTAKAKINDEKVPLDSLREIVSDKTGVNQSNNATKSTKSKQGRKISKCIIL